MEEGAAKGEWSDISYWCQGVCSSSEKLQTCEFQIPNCWYHDTRGGPRLRGIKECKFGSQCSVIDFGVSKGSWNGTTPRRSHYPFAASSRTRLDGSKTARQQLFRLPNRRRPIYFQKRPIPFCPHYLLRGFKAHVSLSTEVLTEFPSWSHSSFMEAYCFNVQLLCNIAISV